MQAVAEGPIQLGRIGLAGSGQIQSTLELGHGLRRIAGQLFGQRQRFGQQTVGGDAGIEKTDLLQGVAVDGSRSEKQTLGCGQSQTVDITLQTVGIVSDSELCSRHAQVHVGDADAEVAGQGQVDGAAIDRAVERGDGWPGEVLQPIDQAGEHQRIGVRIVRQTAEVVTRTEARSSGGEYQRSAVRGLFQGVEMPAQRLDILRFDAVVSSRPIQAQQGDRTLAFELWRCGVCSHG